MVQLALRAPTDPDLVVQSLLLSCVSWLKSEVVFLKDVDLFRVKTKKLSLGIKGLFMWLP